MTRRKKRKKKPTDPNVACKNCGAKWEPDPGFWQRDEQGQWWHWCWRGVCARDAKWQASVTDASEGAQEGT